MMDSVLSIGMNDEVVLRLASITANPKFAYDLYRRFLQMYGNIVLKVPKETFLDIIEEQKSHEGVALESELGVKSLQNLVKKFKEVADVPSDPYEQLRRSIEAIFCSFYSPR
jgi:pyruvate, orthophosphate dikinase